MKLIPIITRLLQLSQQEKHFLQETLKGFLILFCCITVFVEKRCVHVLKYCILHLLWYNKQYDLLFSKGYCMYYKLFIMKSG